MEISINISSWNDFWNLFNKIHSSLLANKQFAVVKGLEEAKSWVDNNGEEWFEFSYAIDFILDNSIEAFNESEKINLITLKNYLDKYLYTL